MGQMQQFLISKFQQEYDRLFLWVPILFSLGITVYFCLYNEPWLGFGWIALTFTSLGFFLLRNHFLGRIASISLLVIASGFVTAQLKTMWLDTPMITEKVKDVVVKGHIDGVEHRPKNIRITMSNLTFNNWPQDQKQPTKIRITFKKDGEVLHPGQTLEVPVVLMPARGPVATGAFDFGLRSYFEGLGAVGFASDEATVISTESIGFIAHIRHQLNMALRQQMKPLTGSVACALITGDRSGIPDKIRQQFADSGIAHILAISGLHLSIIAGLVFLLVRRGFCLFPKLALNMQIKKWAAAISILFTFGYLLLCSGATPAMRAFYMTSFVMLAVIIDRTALTLRNVALAAMFILVLWPEVLFNPSFQMSFAAVTALIAGYERYRGSISIFTLSQYKLPKGVNYAAGIILTTLIASVATAPYTIFTFNRFAIHAIEANLIAIPLTTFWIMPAALISVLTLPLGLADYPLLVFGWGIDILIEIADTVSSWPAAVVLVPQMSGWLIGFVTLGCLWTVIWKTPWRWLGMVPVAACTLIMMTVKTPDVFISKQAGVVALRDSDTLWLNDVARGYYISDTWRQLAGLTYKKDLSEHPDFTCDEQLCHGKLNGVSISLSRGWRQVPRKCASVMLSLSHIPKYCKPQMQLTGKDLYHEGTYTYGFKNGMMALRESPTIYKRPWVQE